MSLDLFAMLPVTKLGEVECYCTPRNIGDLSVWSDGAIHLGNITHNLNTMAEHVQLSNSLTLYDILWHADEHLNGDIDQLRPLWIEGYEKVKACPELSKFNARNGYGTYEGFIRFLERIITDSEPLLGIGVKCESDR